jgi:hypothetical protein
MGEYAAARVGAVVLALLSMVGGGTVLVSLAATAAPGALAAGQLMRVSAGAVGYALGFAVVLGPVAMAALGARSRAGGYFSLLAVLLLPLALARWTRALVPPEWAAFVSIPSALDALRDAIDAGRLAEVARALAVLALFAGLGLAVVRRRARALASEGKS